MAELRRSLRILPPVLMIKGNEETPLADTARISYQILILMGMTPLVEHKHRNGCLLALIILSPIQYSMHTLPLHNYYK
jgi:hypothetical protein